MEWPVDEGGFCLQEFGRDLVAIGRQILQGEGELKDVSAIQRLGKAAADPLVSLAHHSLGLLVSLAVNSGLGVVRIGVGEVSPTSNLQEMTRAVMCPDLKIGLALLGSIISSYQVS
jgi:hypothetical protein